MKYPTLGKEHSYLGHFRGCLKEGHNTNPFDKIDTSLPPKKPEKPKPKAPWPGGIRG
jgi:hypothetical protein